MLVILCILWVANMLCACSDNNPIWPVNLACALFITADIAGSFPV